MVYSEWGVGWGTNNYRYKTVYSEWGVSRGTYKIDTRRFIHNRVLIGVPITIDTRCFVCVARVECWGPNARQTNKMHDQIERKEKKKRRRKNHDNYVTKLCVSSTILSKTSNKEVAVKFRLIIITMKICKAPTPWLKAQNKHNIAHIM